MGHGRWSTADWRDWAGRNTAGRNREEIFTSRGLLPEYDPARIRIRESRDGPDNAASTPIVLASDVTGSLGEVARILMQDKLGVLVSEILARKPVSDPHIMAMAVGDATCDRAPLQATQFEADIRLAEQMRQLFVEGGGGGNGGESYALPWLFCGTKTATDSFEKRGKRGYLFSFGDEPILPYVTREEAAQFLGIRLERDATAAECLGLAQRSYDVFHVILREGFSATDGGFHKALRTWQPLLGRRLLILDDYRNLAELVVSAIQVAEGVDPDDAASSWANASAAASVRAALAPPSSGFFGTWFR
ncbi:hypothetical protein [Methylobacterium brachythecii]|uniref:Uncharacterized protein n=1 Tax=Methylobacterium brachythecii TaxID=1176177 RepID=A0A7W6F5C2_9HYPH|nr:hypothetical protein [Methylobacterium brachythecii]MBB3901192.1 hypothetical protein [Methylobacterium brachythecii]GLS44625.1 hypothetical protein GCM10007884_26130 [Methylobacterium brachythecii]